MYGWPKSNTENSPQELEWYRAYYNQQIGAALCGESGWIYSEKSHIWQAVWIAVLNRTCRLEICRKLVQTVVDDDVDALDVLYDLGADCLSEDQWNALKSKLERLIVLGEAKPP
jgi:hypothetical protein